MEPAALALIVLIPSFVYEPRGALAAIFLLVGAAAWGSAVLAKLDLEKCSPLERFLHSTGAGLGVLIFVLFLLGLAGLYYWPVFALLLGAPVVVWHRKLRVLGGDLWSIADAWSEDPRLGSSLVSVSVFFFGVFLVVAMMLMLAPTVAHDSLLMHLPAARHFASVRSLSPLPFQTYSYYPQDVEVLMTTAYILGGQAAVQFVHPIFLALALGAVASIGRRVGLNRAVCFLVMPTLLAVPFLLWTGAVAKNDLAMAAFQLLAIGCGLGARDDMQASRLRLGVFFLATSLAVKYTAFFGVPWIGLLFLYQLRDRPRKLREAGLWAVIVIVFALCWQARAYALTGNPLFPTRFSRLVGHIAPELGTGPRWYGPSHLEIPWFVHFTGRRAFQSPSENPLGFFLLLTLPAWLLLKRPRWNRSLIALCFVCGCYYLLWGAVYPFLRYGIVPLAIVFLLACERLESSFERANGRLRAGLAGLVVYNFLFCLLPVMIVSINGPQLLLFSGHIDKAEYLRRTLVTYGAMEYLQREAARGELILGARVYTPGYAPVAGAFNPVFFRDGHGMKVAAALAERRYGFLVTRDTKQGRRLAQDLPPGYQSTLEYEDGRCVVFRLETSE